MVHVWRVGLQYLQYVWLQYVAYSMCDRLAYSTFLATIEFKPQRNVWLPGLGVNADVLPNDGRLKNVADDPTPVNVTVKNLVENISVNLPLTPRKYVFDVNSIGQRSSPWTCYSVEVEMKFHVECKHRFPWARLIYCDKCI